MVFSGKKCLNTDHMGVVNDLMLSTIFSVNDFQDTLPAPTLKADGTWNLTSNGFVTVAHTTASGTLRN